MIFKIGTMKLELSSLVLMHKNKLWLPEDVHDVCRLLVFDTAVKRFDKPRELWDGFCSMVKVSHAHPVCTYNEDT